MTVHIPKTEYSLISLVSGNTFNDRGWTLEAPNEERSTLIRAVYNNRFFPEVETVFILKLIE